MTPHEAVRLLAEALGKLLRARVVSDVGERGASLRLALDGLLIWVELLCEDLRGASPADYIEDLPADAVLAVRASCRDPVERGDVRLRAKILASEV